MAMDALHTSDSPMNGGNVPLLFSADCITRLHCTLASLEKGDDKNRQIFVGGIFPQHNWTGLQAAAAAAQPIPRHIAYVKYACGRPLCKGAMSPARS